MKINNIDNLQQEIKNLDSQISSMSKELQVLIAQKQSFLHIKQKIDTLLDENVIYFPITWFSPEMSSHYLFGILLKKKPEIEIIDKIRLKLIIPKTEYAKETNTQKSYGFAHCPKELDVDILDNYALIPKDVAKFFYQLAKEYTGSANIMLCLLILLRTYALQSVSPNKAFTTTNKFLASVLQCSQGAIGKAMSYLVDNEHLVKYITGSVFTCGSLYKFSNESVVKPHNIKYQLTGVEEYDKEGIY